MWEYEGFASEGVKSVAEHGGTKKLEAELKAKVSEAHTVESMGEQHRASF